MKPLTFLGTGLLGHAFAEAALRRGHPVTVWNRTRARAADLADLGARVADTPADAVRGAAVVHLVLHDDPAVDAVLADLPAHLDAVVVDHTTAAPAAVAERAAARPGYLHAPVFMSPNNARNGDGLVVVSGAEALYGRVAEHLATVTGRVWYVGARPDLAAVYKLLGNAMLLTIAGGLADVFALAHQGGLDPQDALQLFRHFDPGGSIRVRGARMAAGDTTPSFHLATARKDAQLMLELAAGAPLAVLPGVAARMDQALADGHADLDYGVIGAEKYTGRDE